MELKARKTHAFIEVKVDEVETTIFKSDQDGIADMIYNLLNVVNDLAEYTGKSVSEYVNEYGF